MPFVKKPLKDSLLVVSAKNNMSNAQDIIVMRGSISQQENMQPQSKKIGKPLTITTVENKPKRKRRRKRGSASHLVGNWRAPARPRKSKPVEPTPVNGDRVIKRRRRLRDITLTSPQRASLRQIISKRRISLLKPVESLRTVEFTKNPEINVSDCNKILFAAALELLPSRPKENEKEDDSDSGVILGNFEVHYETTWIQHDRFKANAILKKKIETVHDAWKAMVLNEDLKFEA